MSADQISVVKVAHFGATLGTLGENGQPLAYLTVRTRSGDDVRFQIDSAHTATELSAILLDVANEWPV